MNKFIIINDNIGERVDKFLAASLPELSRSHIAKLIEEEHVLVNSKPCKASLKLKENDEVIVEDVEVKPLEISKEDIPLDIIYEDDDILIINKPQGMVVHPANGHYEHTLVNAL